MMHKAHVIDDGAEHELPLLRLATALCLFFAMIGTLMTGNVSRYAGGASVALIVVIPFARVADLSWRWARRGDRRFAAIGVLLLAVVVGGAAIALAGR